MSSAIRELLMTHGARYIVEYNPEVIKYTIYVNNQMVCIDLNSHITSDECLFLNYIVKDWTFNHKLGTYDYKTIITEETYVKREPEFSISDKKDVLLIDFGDTIKMIPLLSQFTQFTHNDRYD